MGQAVRLQLGRQSDDEFRETLADFYRLSDVCALSEQLEFAELRRALERPESFKVGVFRLAGDDRQSGRMSRLKPWGRRFALLQQLNIRCDVLVLRKGAQVPPHGHSRVVSGFLLLEGRVACRHYDRVREEKGGLLVREALNVVHAPGGYTTNSERYHNIHWLQGIAPVSYLFRVTVTNTPTPTFSEVRTTNKRVYVDPTGPVGDDGLILARYVSEAMAKELQLVSAADLEVVSASE